MEGGEFETYFDFESVSGTTKYVTFWLDNYSQNLLSLEKLHDRLKKIFSGDSPHLIKVFDGYEFRAVFIQRSGKKRLYHLACHLLIINMGIFKAIDWEIMLTKKDCKKLMKKLKKIENSGNPS
jgi:hypothetical protein